MRPNPFIATFNLATVSPLTGIGPAFFEIKKQQINNKMYHINNLCLKNLPREIIQSGTKYFVLCLSFY